jgi:hypothetical protein
MGNKEIFLQAINEKKKVKIKANTDERGLIERICIPFDFGPGRIDNFKTNRYHFYDLNSPDGSHILSILPEKLVDIYMLDEEFEPGDYVKWTPKWFVKRDWGNYS